MMMEVDGGRGRKEEREREIFQDAVLLALKMEEGATNQGVQVTSGSWKWQGSRFSPRHSRRNVILSTS